MIIKFVVPLVLLFVMQNNPKQDAPDLEIVGISWRGAVYSMNVYQGAFSLDVKNTGTKKIKSVNWDFYLIDTIRKRTYDRFQLRTDDKVIKPGEKKRLTKRFDYHDPPDYVRAVGQITKVEYEDGSVWERAKQD